MHNPLAISLKSNHALFTPINTPRYAPTQYSHRSSSSSHTLFLNCGGIEMPFPKHPPNSLLGNGDFRSKSLSVKEIDVATLGNLCVDIVLSVPKLPPKNLDERKAYMDQLSRSPPDKIFFAESHLLFASTKAGTFCLN